MTTIRGFTKRFAICTTAIATTFAVGAMLVSITSAAHAAGTTTLMGLGHQMFRPEIKRPAPTTQPQTSTATSASTSSAASSSAANPKASAAKPATAAAKPAAAAASSTQQKPNYRDPQTTIDQFKKTPPTAYLCQAGRSGCVQKYGIPDGRGGETFLDLHFTGLHGTLLPADKARLDKALADAEKVYLSRPGGGSPPLNIHTVHHNN